MILSSKRAAEFLNVNESTVKRWADNGKLKSFKTPGGHRKFKFEDLKKVSEENHYLTPDMSANSMSLKTINEIKNRDYGSLNKKFGKYLLKGDTDASYDLIYLLYLDKVPVAQIFDDVVKKSMENIGDLWSKGLLEIEDEGRVRARVPVVPDTVRILRGRTGIRCHHKVAFAIAVDVHEERSQELFEIDPLIIDREQRIRGDHVGVRQGAPVDQTGKVG